MYVYFGSMGNGDQKKLKIALIKCSKGATVPGGSLTTLKNAVRILYPKAAFAVGTCTGLNSEKTKLGDVVVSSKLTTSVYRTPISRDIGNLIRHAADGWKAPLENRDAWKVRVHCDGDVLSHSEAASYGWQNVQIIQKYPNAIAVETEGEGKLELYYLQLHEHSPSTHWLDAVTKQRPTIIEKSLWDTNRSCLFNISLTVTVDIGHKVSTNNPLPALDNVV